MDSLVEIDNVTKVYRMGEIEVPVLTGVSLTVQRGAVHAVLGPSGCGKTTLLNLIGALDVPTGGRISVDGLDIAGLGEELRTDYRREQVGFVFQFFNLMPLLSAVENVELALEAAARSRQQSKHVRERSMEMLRLVGLADHAHKFPSQLSGGQQQRVAIARALAKGPALVLCDEPTGNLDARTSAAIIELILDLNQRRGTTFIVVTHSSEFAEVASHVTRMLDGAVVEGGTGPRGAEDALERELRQRPRKSGTGT